jgi:hypothetical protein
MPHTQTLPQNHSNNDSVVIIGNVVGTLNDNFHTEGTTKNGVPYQRINFGINVGTEDNPKTIYVELFGTVKKNVYIHRPAMKGERQGETKPIPWDSRSNVPSGYRLIGVGVGLEKDADGKNVYSNLTEYDAISKMAEKLQDGMGVRIRGKIDFNRFEGKNGEITTTTKYIINSIGLYDTTGQDSPVPSWSQNLIITGIEKGENGNFEISVAKVGYNSVAYSTVYTHAEKLATSIRKALTKGYFSCDMWGDVEIVPITEDTVETVDEWGETNPTKHLVNTACTRTLFVTGCDGMNADYDTYTEESLSEFRKELDNREKANQTFEGTAKKKASATDDWGTEINSGDLPF